MGYLYAFAAFLSIGSYLVPVRFCSSKGLAFLPLMGLSLLGLDLVLMEPLSYLWSNSLWFWATMGAGLLWGCGQCFAYLTLEEISLSKASVLFNLNSFVNIALGVLLFKEAANPKALIHILLGGGILFAGAWWVSRIQAAASKEGNLRKGLFWGLVTGAFWGSYFAPIKAIQMWGGAQSLPILSLLSGLALGGAVPALILGFWVRGTRWNIANIGWGAATCLLWAVGMTFFLLANQTLGLSRAVPIVNSNALLYAGWSLFVFKEFPFHQWPKVLGGTVLAVAGVALMVAS